MPDAPLDGQRIVQYLNEVADRLGPDGPEHTVIVVGGLAPRWLNDSAAMFKPTTLRDGDCHVELKRGRLLVLGAPLDQVFVMKLYASRAPDLDDMVTLWPHCTFGSAQAVVDAFHVAYPHLEHDPYLIDHVAAIAAAAG